MNIINNNENKIMSLNTSNKIEVLSDLRLEHTKNNMYRVVYTSFKVDSSKLVDNYLSNELEFMKALEIYLKFKEINNINSFVLISEE